jgi:predicted TIM-barrel fold metal-dependent hydrolase
MREALRKLHFDLAGAPVPELLASLLSVADPQRIHYGSDWPFTPPEVCRILAAKLDETPVLSDEARERIMRDNAVALFDKDGRP